MQDAQDEVVKGKLRPVTSSLAAVPRSRVILWRMASFAVRSRSRDEHSLIARQIGWLHDLCPRHVSTYSTAQVMVFLR